MGDSDKAAKLIVDERYYWGRAPKMLEKFPYALEEVTTWLEIARLDGDSSKFITLANWAAHFQPPGLADAIIPIVENDERSYLLEDMVEILGELESGEAVKSIVKLMKKYANGDVNNQSLCLKCIYALDNIDTKEARESLRGIAVGDYADLLKWHAAFVLEIEEELGFEEDAMTGPVHEWNAHNG